MPTYQYRCGECGHEFEDILSINDRLLPEEYSCPSCQSPGMVKKIMSAPHVVGEGSINPRNIDPTLTNILGQMDSKYPGMKRDLY